MHLFFRKLITSAIFVVYVILGSYLLDYLLSSSFFMNSNTEFIVFLLKIFVLAWGGSFLLTTIPVFIFPKRIWIWCFAYPCKFYVFSAYIFIVTVLETKVFKDLKSAGIWFSVAVIMSLLSWLAGKTTLRFYRIKIGT